VVTRAPVEQGASLIGVAFARSSVLSKLNDEDRSLLRDSMTLHTVRKGQHICAENAECLELGILIEGALAVFVGAGTRERALFPLFPFDMFGDVEFFDGGMSIGRTTVLSKVARYVTVPYDVAWEAGRRDPVDAAALDDAAFDRPTARLVLDLPSQTDLGPALSPALSLRLSQQRRGVGLQHRVGDQADGVADLIGLIG